MPDKKTVDGTMTGINGDKFSAVFTIKSDDGSTSEVYRFTGAWKSNVPNFFVPKAKLEYDNVKQLNAQYTVSGTIGKDDVKFTIENGPKISGALKDEVDPAVDVKGDGAWAFGPEQQHS